MRSVSRYSHRPGFWPNSSSAVNQENGTFVARTAWIISLTCSGLVAKARYVTEERRDLAVVNSPQRSGVLTLNACRPPSFFSESGRIRYEDRAGVGEVFHRVLAVQIQQCIRIPRGEVQEPLERLRFGLADVLGDRPAVLPRERRQQPAEILLRVPSRLCPVEQRVHPPDQTLQLGFPGIQIRACHGVIIHINGIARRFGHANMVIRSDMNLSEARRHRRRFISNSRRSAVRVPDSIADVIGTVMNFARHARSDPDRGSSETSLSATSSLPANNPNNRIAHVNRTLEHDLAL